MKKIIALILVFIMLVSFAGCGVNEEMIADIKPAYDKITYVYETTKSMANDIRIFEEIAAEKGSSLTYDDLKGKFALSDEEFVDGLGFVFYMIAIDLGESETDADDIMKGVNKNPSLGIEFLVEYNLDSYFNNIIIYAYDFYVFSENDDFTIDEIIDEAKKSHGSFASEYSDDEIYKGVGEFCEIVGQFYDYIYDGENYDWEKIADFQERADACHENFGEYFEP